jgi:hypothetical protein
VGAFAENKAFKLALRREFAGEEEYLPCSYVVRAPTGEHTQNILRRVLEITEDCRKEITNTETIRSMLGAFENGHCKSTRV